MGPQFAFESLKCQHLSHLDADASCQREEWTEKSGVYIQPRCDRIISSRPALCKDMDSLEPSPAAKRADEQLVRNLCATSVGDVTVFLPAVDSPRDIQEPGRYQCAF